MSPRTRVYAIVAAVCVAAGAAAGGIVLAAGGGPHAADAALPKGNPPLELDLGLRGDREARDLRRAQQLYLGGNLKGAAEIFARYSSLPALIGQAMAAHPGSAAAPLATETTTHPRDAQLLLNLGLALYWEGKRAAALEAWRRAKAGQPDTPSAVRADDLLHPQFNRGLPTFVPSFRPPPIPTMPARAQMAYLARRARSGGVQQKLMYGIALQRLGRPVSAERQYAQAAALAPSDPDARVAAAVGRFDKDHPERAFSRLGPLTRTFPHAPTVRFHLGLLLLWLGQVKEGKHQLTLARAEGPDTLTGREAALFLRRLQGISQK